MERKYVSNWFIRNLLFLLTIALTSCIRFARILKAISILRFLFALPSIKWMSCCMPTWKKWATTWQNQQNECAPSEDSDKPEHPPVWSESSLSAWRNLGSLATHWAHSEDSDQTGRMPRLIWVFVGLTLILLVLSCRGSNGLIPV